MITEDYLKFEIAKLLKEKGFDEECYLHYSSDGKTQHWNYQSPIDGIPAPTLQMTMKWLREVHKMYMYVAHDSMENTWFARVYNDYKTLSDVDNQSTYEEACEAAIQYCLQNLI